MNKYFVMHSNDEFLINQISKVYADKTLIMISIILFILIVITIKERRQVNDDFLSIETSSFLRGCAVLLLLVGHFYLKCVEGVSFFERAGNWAVVVFLFISGNALYKSYGLSNLTSRFIFRRLDKIILPTWICLLLFYILSYNINHYSYNWIMVALSFACIILPRPPDGPAWFITYILFLYFLYFVSFFFYSFL